MAEAPRTSAVPARSASGRTWGGSTLDARRTARRAQLLATALEMAGEQGSAAVTVRAVCRRTRLTDRYFYESFATRDELLTAVYDQVADQARAALADAVAGAGPDPAARARAAVESFVALILDDPRKGRILLLEPFADPALGAHGHTRMSHFTDLISSQLPPATDEPARTMASLALVGALANLFAAHLRGTLTVPRNHLTDACVHLVLTAHAATTATAPPGQPAPTPACIPDETPARLGDHAHPRP